MLIDCKTNCKIDGKIDDNLISSLEDLSFLSLSPEEKSRLSDELPEILTLMARLGELNTENAAECSSPLENTNVFRDDKALPSFDRELILKNAPNRNGETIIAPKTVD